MGSRADNLDGSCKEILTGKLAGRWRVQFSYRDDYGRLNRISRVFPTKTTAKEFLRSVRQGAKIAETAKGRDLTLEQWFDWLVENDWPESLDGKTIANRVGRFNKHVRSRLGHFPLKRISPLTIRTFYKELRGEGVGVATVQAIKANLVRTFNQAISPYGRVPMSQANPFRLTIQQPQLREAVALTPEEVRKALACDGLSPSERGMLAVFLLSGLRLSEQMALTRRQLLFDQGLIAVDQAVKLDKTGGQSIGLPKGNKKRLAVMCPTLKKILQEIACDLEPGAYLWPAERLDKPRMKKRTYDVWKAIAATASLPPSMSPHDCRLSHINMVEKLLPQVSATTLREHVGHASGSSVTELNYTRPISPAQDLLREGLECLFHPAGRQKRTRKRAAG